MLMAYVHTKLYMHSSIDSLITFDIKNHPVTSLFANSLKTLHFKEYRIFFQRVSPHAFPVH
jgi:hypothetical protein